MDGNGLKKHLWSVAGTIVLALLLQTFTAIWWASGIDTRMDHVEKDVSQCEARVHRLETRP